MSKQDLLNKLDEAKKHHEQISGTINIGSMVGIKPEIFQEMLEWGINDQVRINAGGGQATRPNGKYAHAIEYQGTIYRTETSKRIILKD